MAKHKYTFDRHERGARADMAIAFCDGSCPRPNGPGGWGWVILFEGKVDAQGSGYAPVATNNTMELEAARQCMRGLAQQRLLMHPTLILSDSQYVVDGMTKYKPQWRARDYAGVKNSELWRNMHDMGDELTGLIWGWVRGHAGNYWNEYVDHLAGQARERQGK